MKWRSEISHLLEHAGERGGRDLRIRQHRRPGLPLTGDTPACAVCAGHDILRGSRPFPDTKKVRVRVKIEDCRLSGVWERAEAVAVVHRGTRG